MKVIDWEIVRLVCQVLNQSHDYPITQLPNYQMLLAEPRLFDVIRDLLHRRKPYAGFGLDVRDQPIQLHDPRPASADMRMLREDEHRPFLKGEIELGLVDLEHRIR